MLRLGTPSCSISHTHIHSPESRDFPPQLFFFFFFPSDIIHNLMKDPLSAVPSSSSLSVSSASFLQEREKNHASSISVPAFLLFPRQQWQRIFPQKDSANGVGCCLGGCIIGVSGASSLCLCILDVYVRVGNRMDGWMKGFCVYTYACMLSCGLTWMSAAGSVC